MVMRYSNEQLIQTVIISLILDQIQRSNYCALRCAALRMPRWNVSGVLVALTIQQNLISVSKATEVATVLFKENSCELEVDGEVVLVARKVKGIYIVDRAENARSP
jgi:hypothetical protein